MSACAPAGSTDEDEERAPPVVAPIEVANDAVCGSLAIAPAGEWRTDHPYLASLRAGWHPGAENGWPIAVRDAVAPWEFPGHTFVQVHVGGVPRDVEACWVPTASSDRRACAVLWQMIHESAKASRPRTAHDWARLVATADQASASFTTPEELAACDGAPPLPGWRPGLHGSVDEPQLTFVERFDLPRATVWLRVDVGWKSDVLDIERSEIATVRSDAPAAAPEHVPAWDGVWPISDDPVRKLLDLRVPRIHPLWRTPVDEACPSTTFSTLTPDSVRGDTFARVQSRLSTVAERRLAVSPTAIMPVHDRIGLPGVSLVAAMDTDAGCMMGWSFTHCLVADDAVWCPDATAADLQAIVDRFALQPSALTDAQWFELAVVMTGTSHVVLAPALLSACTNVAGARAIEPRVVRGWNRVTIEFTAIDDGHGRDVSVTIASGRVSMTAEDVWTAPDPDAMWGER